MFDLCYFNNNKKTTTENKDSVVKDSIVYTLMGKVNTVKKGLDENGVVLLYENTNLSTCCITQSSLQFH